MKPLGSEYISEELEEHINILLKAKSTLMDMENETIPNINEHSVLPEYQNFKEEDLETIDELKEDLDKIIEKINEKNSQVFGKAFTLSVPEANEQTKWQEHNRFTKENVSNWLDDESEKLEKLEAKYHQLRAKDKRLVKNRDTKLENLSEQIQHTQDKIRFYEDILDNKKNVDSIAELGTSVAEAIEKNKES